MQHLFNRIYIAPISALENQHNDDGAVAFITSNPAVCSAIALHTQQGDMEDVWFALQGIRFKLDVGDFVFHYLTYADMIQNQFGGSDDAFMQYLMDWPSARRLVLYVDMLEMGKFMVRWMKTLLPHATTESIRTCMHIISLREQLFITNRKLSIPVPVGRLYKTAIIDEVNTTKFSISDAGIEQLLPFNITVPVTSMGAEFLFATYLYNTLQGTPDQALTDIVEDKLLRFVKRRLVYSLMDDKDGVVQSMYHSPALFGCDVDITDPASVAAFISQHPEHSWLFDDGFRTDNYQTIWATYDIAEVFASGNSLVRTISKESAIYNASRHDLLKKVFKNDITLRDILDVELADHYSCLILAAEVTDKAMNRYLIDYFLHLFKTSQPDQLKCYTI